MGHAVKSFLANLKEVVIVFLIVVLIAAGMIPSWFAQNIPESLGVVRVLPVKADVVKGEQVVFSLVNQERIKNGLKPLVWDERLAVYSRHHSDIMAMSGVLYHDKSELAIVNAGENALMMPKSYGGVGFLIFYLNFYRDSDALWRDSVQAWMESPGHKDNILTASYTYTAIGIAVASDGVTYYLTQNFQ